MFEFSTMIFLNIYIFFGGGEEICQWCEMNAYSFRHSLPDTTLLKLKCIYNIFHKPFRSVYLIPFGAPDGFIDVSKAFIHFMVSCSFNIFGMSLKSRDQ